MRTTIGKRFFLFFLLSSFVLNATSSVELEEAIKSLEQVSMFCYLKNCMYENVDADDFTEEEKKFLNEEISDYDFIFQKTQSCRQKLKIFCETLLQDEPNCLMSDNYDDIDVKVEFFSFNKVKTGCEWLVKGTSVIWALKIIYDFVL